MSGPGHAHESAYGTSLDCSRQHGQPALAVDHGSLAARLLQQGLLADFGRVALEAESLEPLLDRASAAAVEGLRAARAAILERPSGAAAFEVRSSAGGVPPHGLGTAEMRRAATHALQTRGASIWARPLRQDTAQPAQPWDGK